MTQPPLTLRRWKWAEYARLVGLGVFEGDPVELIGGQLIVAEPQFPYHASAINAADYALRSALPSGWMVRTQSPVSLDDESEPEPGLVVVPGHPVYGRAGLQDYWIVNLIERVLEVYREPIPDAAAPMDGGTGQW
jgi:hypothetical protein